MFYTVYKITNLLNGKYYIGKHQTETLDDDYMGSGKLITRAIKKYGKENFKKEILFVFDTEEEMNAKEAEIVIVSEETYNLCAGGQGGFGYINSNIYIDHKKLGIKGAAGYIKRLNDDIDFRNLDSKIKSERAKKRHLNGSLHGFDRNINIELSKRSRSSVSIIKKKNTYAKIQHQQGNKNSQFGTVWIFHEILGCKKIKKELISDYCNSGWCLGRKKQINTALV